MQDFLTLTLICRAIATISDLDWPIESPSGGLTRDGLTSIIPTDWTLGSIGFTVLNVCCLNVISKLLSS